jgi:hypothetical protein
LEFTLPRNAYLRLGGHDDAIRSLPNILQNGGEYPTAAKLSPRGQG